MRNNSRQRITGSSSRNWCLRRQSSMALAKSSVNLSLGCDISGLGGRLAGQEQARGGVDFRIKLALPRQEALAVEEIKAFVLSGGCHGEVLPVQAFDQPLFHAS